MTGYTVNYSGGGDTGSVNVGPSTTATTITGRINDGYAYIITGSKLSLRRHYSVPRTWESWGS